jgi:DNA repair protein RadA/Sms
LTVSEPAIDLGVAAAVLSSFRNKPIRRDIALIGEVGLGGEIRPVNNMVTRFKELARMGFKQCVVTKPRAKADWAGNNGIELVFCEQIADLQEHLF